MATAPAQRIVIVLHDLPLGGSERIAVRLANRWAALGREVILYCGDASGPLAAMVDATVRLEMAKPTIRRGVGSRARLGRALAARLPVWAPDLVYFPGNYQWPVLAACAPLAAAGRPAVVAQISTPMARHGRSGLRQLRYDMRTRGQLRHADATVSLSPVMTEVAERLLDRRMTWEIPLPALDDTVRAAAPAAGRTILAAGRLETVKGFDVALQAFARLDDPQARLVIVGEGGERGALEALARRLGIADRVEMPGYVPDTGPWLARCRTFLLSSWYEGYAAVVLEALAAGRPVVATDCTPAAALLRANPACGAVAQVGDAADIARALRDVLDAPAPDPAALSATVAGFRIGPIAEAYLRLFDVAVTRRRMLSAPGARRTA